MGKCSSKTAVKEDPSVSYISAESEEETGVSPRPLHSGPIHALCSAHSSYLISGGADEVIHYATSLVHHYLRLPLSFNQRLAIYEWSRHVVKQVYTGPFKEVTEVCVDR